MEYKKSLNWLHISIVLIFLCTLHSSYSQTINGTVVSAENQEPIENVNVILSKQNIGASTNSKGLFNLKLKHFIKPTDTLHFSFVGYKTVSYTFSNFKALNAVVQLQKKTEELDGITVASKKILKPRISYTKITKLKKGVSDFGVQLIGNSLYIEGGDQSYIEETEKKAMNNIQSSPNANLGMLLKELRFNPSFESYSEKLQIYNLDTDEWSIVAHKFKKRAYHNMVSDSNSLYILGGKTLSKTGKYEYLDNTIEVLNLHTNEVAIDETNPHQAINFAAFKFQSDIIVMGGSTKLKKTGEKIFTNQMHLYDTKTGYWYALENMRKPKEVSGLVVNHKLYLIGGLNKKPLTEIESYDLVTAKWEKEGDLFYGIENPGLAYADNIIYIYDFDSIFTFNLKTKKLNEYHINLQLQSAKMVYYDSSLYIIGGFIKSEFTKSTSSAIYKVDVNDFYKTQIQNSKTQ